jgi:poly-gamma-glutamate capsule biosynthesis protein CapA/YwtB (metallophosphatase superfamily)
MVLRLHGMEEVGVRFPVSPHPFLEIASTTRSADIAFANLETTVSDRGRKIGSEFSFRSDPRTVEGLQYAGFDVVSVANNHIWDYADDAFMDTQRYLRDAGIAYAGGGANYEEAHAPAILAAKGVRVAYLAYTNLLSKFFTRPTSAPASAAYDDWGRVVQDIKNAKSKADIVVVSYHWGVEYQTHHNAEQEDIAKKTIDAGADLVIGGHPHVQQEIVPYKNGWIAYSMGNFVFDQYFQPEVMESRIFEVDFTGKTITGAKMIPVRITTGSQPEISGEPVVLK